MPSLAADDPHHGPGALENFLDAQSHPKVWDITTNPNKQNLDSPAIESNKKDEPVKAAGFSDLFCAPPDPDLEADIPISLSSGSLVSMLASGEATPAPTKPPLPHPGSRNASIISLEYPEGYDPLKDSGKCWETGKEQVT